MIDRIRQYIFRKRFKRNVRRWFRLKGDQTLRLDYPLKSDSVVFDVGGYQGDFAAEIFARYHCRIHVFEPVKKFYDHLLVRFKDCPQITAHAFGLGGRSETATISLAGDRSSHVQEGLAGQSETIEIKAFTDFAREHNIGHIDLLKLNIEGAEFELLETLLAAGWADRIANIQVQFHHVGPDAPRRRQALRAQLARTHELTYDFYFVWENWRRRANTATPL